MRFAEYGRDPKRLQRGVTASGEGSSAYPAEHAGKRQYLCAVARQDRHTFVCNVAK